LLDQLTAGDERVTTNRGDGHEGVCEQLARSQGIVEKKSTMPRHPVT